jgi:carboxylesterase
MRVPSRISTPGSGSKEPLFIRGGERGVLCLHGFTGTPFEVRPLAEGLAQRGFTTLAPLLAGHGESVSALSHTRWPDWLASAKRALDELRASVGGAPVGIAGFSMGGLLALTLAYEFPGNVSALAVLSSPLGLPRFDELAVKALAHLPKFLRRGPLAALPKFRGSDVLDPEMKNQNPSLTALPYCGVASMLELGRKVRDQLPSIHVPTLLAHGARDRTIAFSNSLEIGKRLGARSIDRVPLPNSGHLIGIDVERTVLIEALVRFFGTHVPLPSAKALG